MKIEMFCESLMKTIRIPIEDIEIRFNAWNQTEAEMARAGKDGELMTWDGSGTPAPNVVLKIMCDCGKFHIWEINPVSFNNLTWYDE